MHCGLLFRSLILIFVSHVIIFIILYSKPGLVQQIEAVLPPVLNGTLTVAMSAVMAGMRRPTAFLTRSIILSNPQFRAGKPVRTDIARAYRVFTDLSSNIRRSLDPYKVATSSFHSSARASATPHISLHIAVSSCGKRDKFSPERSTFDYIPSDTEALGLQKGATLQERRQSRPLSGQDAYFVARVGKDSNSTAFAIADGVGGWQDHGVDPADFSHGLCSYMAQYALRWSDSNPPGPKHLLNLGYDALLNDEDIQAGGSTACVGVVDETGRMRIANLGDSGFVQLRLGKVHHNSEPQTHQFNTPYQLSIVPAEIMRQSKIFGGVPLVDLPDKADLADYILKHGDVVVLATDGVWDNLDAQDVLKIVNTIMRSSGAWELQQTHGYAVASKIHDVVQREKAQEYSLKGTLQSTIAAAIVGEAKSAGLSKVRDSPFGKALRKEYPGENWVGGKADDIAVLVAVTVDPSKQQEIKAKL